MPVTINIQQALLRKLALYFYGRSLGFSLKEEDIQVMTWDAQEEFLNLTVNNSRVQKYPVNNNFCRLFFKKLIDQLQPFQDVHDGLFTSLCSVLSSETSDMFCYRHYVIGGDLNNVITIKETNNMVVNGTTGLKTWEAALMLTDWALCHKQVFQKKRILELGSGVGLTGISIAKLCGPAETVLTDCHEEVLRTICQNIEINFPTSAKEETIEETYYRNGETSVGVRTLDWNFIADLPSEVIPDVVIGADIIYDPFILQPLCNAFDVLCSRNSNLTIYIQSVIRNEETFLMFTELLEKMEFQSESIEQKKCVYMHWDTETDRKLLKINKKTHLYQNSVTLVEIRPESPEKPNITYKRVSMEQTPSSDGKKEEVPGSKSEKKGEAWGYDLYPERRGTFSPKMSNILLGREGKEGIEKMKCEQNVVDCVKKSPIVQIMMKALKSSGCPIDIRRHISCEVCDYSVSGGYDPELNQIVVCQNSSTRYGMVQSVLAHEMIHMFDYCRNELDFRNMEHLACTEIRAANLTHCSFTSASSQGDASFWKIRKAHQDCVKTKALYSVMAVRQISKAEAVDIIEKVFPKCYADLEPIGRRIRRNSDDMMRAFRDAAYYGYE